MRVYAVIDTNVLVSSLLTGRADSPTVKVVKAISDGTLIPLYNEEIMKEYDDVLHRKKFPFTEKRIRPGSGVYSRVWHGRESQLDR